MKAKDFVNKAIDISNNYKTLYVMGCFGSPLNTTNKKRYTNNNDYNRQSSRTKMINAATSDTFGFDCVNLLKGIFWGWNGNKTLTYGGAKYATNGVPDVNANTMYKSYCTNHSTDFSKIEVGEFLWVEGHIGVYIGNGLAVECTPAFKNKVQITAVGNIGKKSGYSTRNWSGHGKSKFIEYEKIEESKIDASYYPKYTGKSNSLVDALKSLKIDSSFINRGRIAKKNNISLYIGTSKQNNKLFELLKEGKLKK